MTFRIFFLFIALVTGGGVLTLHSQEAYPTTLHQEPLSVFLPDSFNTYIFGETTQVRKAPSLQGERIAVLPIGHPVQVLAHDTAMLTLQGRAAYWHRITWLDEQNQKREGWVWGGLLAQGFGDIEQTLFLIGYTQSKEILEKGRKITHYEYEIKAVRNERLLDRHEMSHLYFHEAQIMDFSIYGSRGLTQAKNIINFNWSGACCGCGGEEHTLIWNGVKFEPLPVLKHWGEWGTGGYETYFFPEDQSLIDEYEDGRFSVFFKFFFQQVENKSAILLLQSEDMYDETGASYASTLQKMIFQNGIWKKP